MAARVKQKNTAKPYLKFKRYMSALSLVCVFLVVIGGLKARVSIEEITIRSMIVLLCIFATEVVLVKTWNAWQIQNPAQVKAKTKKK